MSARLGMGVMLALFVLLVGVMEPAAVVAQSSDQTATAEADTLPVFVVKKKPWLAVTETIGVNLLIWSFNRFIREGGTNPGFRISLESWEENSQDWLFMRFISDGADQLF